MKHRRYPGYLFRVIPRVLLLLITIVLPVFISGFVLMVKTEAEWPLFVTPVAGMGLFAIIEHFWMRRVHSRLVCPACGAKGMRESVTDGEDVLTCLNCGCIWSIDMGPPA